MTKRLVSTKKLQKNVVVVVVEAGIDEKLQNKVIEFVAVEENFERGVDDKLQKEEERNHISHKEEEEDAYDNDDKKACPVSTSRGATLTGTLLPREVQKRR